MSAPNHHNSASILQIHWQFCIKTKHLVIKQQIQRIKSVFPVSLSIFIYFILLTYWLISAPFSQSAATAWQTDHIAPSCGDPRGCNQSQLTAEGVSAPPNMVHRLLVAGWTRTWANNAIFFFPINTSWQIHIYTDRWLHISSRKIKFGVEFVYHKAIKRSCSLLCHWPLIESSP